MNPALPPPKKKREIEQKRNHPDKHNSAQSTRPSRINMGSNNEQWVAKENTSSKLKNQSVSSIIDGGFKNPYEKTTCSSLVMVCLSAHISAHTPIPKSL